MKSCCPRWLKYLLLHLRASPVLAVKHRLPFSGVSFALWWSPRLLTAYFALLVIRSSLCSLIPVSRDHCYAPTPLSFQSSLALPDSPCLRDRILVSSGDLIHCGFVHNCCRGNRFFLVQIEGLKVQSRQRRTAVNDALLHHPSSIVPPRAWGANPASTYFSMSPSSA